MVAQLAREKGVTLHAYVDPMIPPVRGDGDRLRQILLNLLGNAVKFTERGRVVARARRWRSTARDIVVRFEVQDTGIGIPPEMLAAFSNRSRRPTFRVAEFGGTGLGLSISKRLVELMGGEIGVQSEPGAGSLFWFTARFAPVGNAAAVHERTLEGIGGLILSGDDDVRADHRALHAVVVDAQPARAQARRHRRSLHSTPTRRRGSRSSISTTSGSSTSG